MTQDSNPSPDGTHEATAAPAAHAPGHRPRAVQSGDVPPSMQPEALETHLTDRAMERAYTVRSMVVADALRDSIAREPAVLDEVQAMIDGASPDDVRALRACCSQRLAVTGDGANDADTVLAPGWREGALSVPQPAVAAQLRAAEVPAAGRAAEAAGLGQGDRRARRDPVRGPRRRRQGRHDQALHGAPEPARRRVVALEKPSEIERGQWYFQRYIEHLPTRGEIVLFDRSWYNRAGVERVMGFCTEAEYDEFMRQMPEFERQLVRSGIHLFKFWFSVSREEQRRRFKERKLHPLKQWKLSPIDLASLDKWDDYTRAKEAMFLHCDTSDAPWTVIKSDCKKRARLNAMRYVLHRMPYTRKDPSLLGPVDPLIVGRPSLVPSVGDDQLAGT